jgi:hypothetical protein
VKFILPVLSLIILISCSQSPCIDVGYIYINPIPQAPIDRHLKAVGDFSYALDYLKYIDSTKNAIHKKAALSLIKKLAAILVNNPKYLPGYPKYNSNRDLLEKYGFPLLPGVDTTTWCNVFVYDVIELYYPGKARRICERRGINFTDANEMVYMCELRLKRVDKYRAMMLAESGRLAIVAAKGIGDNDGHLALLLPSIPNRPLYVAQAGVVNGFVELSWAFAVGAGIVEAPKYYEVL